MSIRVRLSTCTSTLITQSAKDNGSVETTSTFKLTLRVGFVRKGKSGATMDNGQPMLDALAKLELAMRPQSVPSWLSSDTNHAPKVTALGPRTSSVELIDQTATHGIVGAAVGGGNGGVHGTSPRKDKSGPVAPSPSAIRPRAPIGMHKDAVSAVDKEFLQKGSEHPSPKRSRQRVRQQAAESKSR